MRAPWERQQSCKISSKLSLYPQPLTPATCEGARGPGWPVWPSGQLPLLIQTWMTATTRIQTHCSWNWRENRLRKFQTATSWKFEKKKSGKGVFPTLTDNLFWEAGKIGTSWTGERFWKWESQRTLMLCHKDQQQVHFILGDILGNWTNRDKWQKRGWKFKSYLQSVEIGWW